MPTIISSSTFSTQFDLVSVTKQFTFTDTFNYSAYGIPTSGVKDCFAVTAPGGAAPYYINTNFAAPDIDLNSGTTNTTTIPLQLLPTGAPVPGVYTIVMTTQVNDGVNPVYYVTSTSKINFTFVAPTITINQAVDCIGANFTSTDTTNYVVDGIMPVVVRTHDVNVPGVPSPTTYTSAAPVLNLTSGQFYNGLQTTTITSVCTWTYPNGSSVTATLTGTKSVAVDCTYFCAIYCCLRSINSNIKKYKGVNDYLANQYEVIFSKVMGLVELATLAYSCGKSNDVAGYVAQIQELADCTSDCSCQDGTPSPVYGLGGGGTGVTVVVDTCGNGISVTSSTVGNTTTYTVCLDPALVTKINASYNTVVVAGTGITVTPSGIINNVQTYTIDNTIPEREILAFNAIIQYVGGVAVVSVDDVSISGASFQAPTITDTTSGFPNYPSLNNLFEITNFWLAAPATTYKVLATLTDTQYTSGIFTSIPPLTSPQYSLDVGGVNLYTNKFYIRFVNSKAGQYPTNKAFIKGKYKFTVSIQIIL